MPNGTDGTCCPPQTAPEKPKVAHPVSRPSGYEPEGSYESLGAFEKVYVTGDRKAKTALVSVYDIFGFWETTLKGQDLTAERSSTPLTIYMPDLFRGRPFPKEKDGDKEELQKFFGGTAKLDDRLPELLEFGRLLKEEKGYEKVFVMGYCWGGKLVLLALSSTLPSPTPFTAGAIVHPAMISPEDGDNLSVPLAFFPSQDEPSSAVQHISSAMKQKLFGDKCEFKLYDTVHHGWAAARADLEDEENRKMYDDVYQRLPKYFSGLA